MWDLFRQDLQRWVVPSQVAPPGSITLGTALRLLIRYKPVRATLMFRISRWADNRGVPLLTGFALRWMYTAYGLEITAKSAKGGLYLAHTVGMVINAETIGENCSFIAGITVGLHKGRGRPVFGDGVYVGAGARVLGGITIGDGAKIGANAVVLKDVPAGATAVGIPARIIQSPADQEIERSSVLAKP